jgi:hypothetical protein
MVPDVRLALFCFSRLLKLLVMSDVLYLVIALVFFLLTLGLVWLCDRLLR